MYFQFINSRYWLHTKNDVIFYRAEGQFGVNESLHATKSINKCVDSIPTETFAMIVDTTGLVGVTHDCKELWMQTIDYWYQQGHRAMLRIGSSNSISYRVFLAEFDRYYNSRLLASLHPTAHDAIMHATVLGFHPGDLCDDLKKAS